MRPFWIGLVAGIVLVGLGVGIGVSIQTERSFPPSEPVATAPAAPVRISGAQSSAGWVVYFHLPERARSIEYRRGGDSAWTALGANPHDIDLATGAARAKTYAILGELEAPTRFSVRYTSDAGVRRGPFDLTFDPRAESVEALKSLLDDLPRWVEVREYEGRRLAYFTSLLVYKPAIAEIRYGVDAGDPDRGLRFSPSDRLGVEARDQMYIELPPRARELVVEVIFRDGSRRRQRIANLGF